MKMQHQDHGHDDACDEINHQIEDVSVDFWRMLRNVDLSCKGAIDAIENLAHEKPHERGANSSIEHGFESEQSGNHACGGEHVETEPSSALPRGG